MVRLACLALILGCLWPTSAVSQTRPWTTEETYWALGDVAAAYADWNTTRDIIGRPSYRELNPLIGPHPSQARLNQHFMIAVPMILFAADYFEKDRTTILQMFTAVEILATGNNLNIGLRFKF